MYVATTILANTVEPVWKDHPIGHKKLLPETTCLVVPQDRWYPVTGSITVKPVLGNHCRERPPVLKDHTDIFGRRTYFNIFQYN